VTHPLINGNMEIVTCYDDIVYVNVNVVCCLC